MEGKLLSYPPEVFAKRVDIPSPFSGQLLPLTDLEDTLFKKGFYGPGAAISSTANTVYAPFNGTVLKVEPIDYAIEVKSSVGLKCRIKYGFDAHHLHGAQFNCGLKKGDRFSIKTPLFTVNSVWLKQQGVANICIMTVLNAHALLGVLAASHRYVEANEDTLLSLYI